MASVEEYGPPMPDAHAETGWTEERLDAKADAAPGPGEALLEQWLDDIQVMLEFCRQKGIALPRELTASISALLSGRGEADDSSEAGAASESTSINGPDANERERK